MTEKIDRRRFLVGAGTALAGAALACGRQRGVPTAEPTAEAMLTPVPTQPPTAPSATATPSALIKPTAPAGQAADLVLLNGKVITVDAADSIAQAVAIQSGLIQTVGSDADLAAVVGEQTQVIDLGGRTLTPGLIDAHIHFQVMGLMNSYYVALVPPEVTTIEDMRAKIADVIGGMPAGEWFKGYFIVVKGGGLPTRHDLDPVSPNHPVWIVQQGGHYGSANSLALQIAGITADTPDPVGGVIGRGANGEPDGVFYNHRAMDLLRLHVPVYTQEDVEQNIASTQPLFAACGVTSFQDNNVRGTDTVGTYLAVGRRGDMYLRGAVYYTLEWPKDLDRALNEIERYEDEFMRLAGYKFLLDGQIAMAYCHEPHEGERWDTPTWEPQRYKDTVRALHDTGLQICVHCFGDAAVDLTLDAFEEAMNANPRPDPRHRIEHCVLCTPEATQRMKDLGVVVSTQPQFIRLGGDIYPDYFGEERTRRAIVTREWLDSGVTVALGSDAPSTPWYTPQVTLFGAVTRITFSNQFHEPDQALTVQEALRAHTMGSAYAAHEENVKGSIEVGKMADLAVWSEDPYTAPLQRLWQIPVDMTLVGGEIVFQGGEASLAPRRAREIWG
jgi:predicted amidohydrolase YtcJ